MKNITEESEKWGHLLDCLFRYFDGETTILDIATKHDLPFEDLRRYIARFEEKNGALKSTCTDCTEIYSRVQ